MSKSKKKSKKSNKFEELDILVLNKDFNWIFKSMAGTVFSSIPKGSQGTIVDVYNNFQVCCIEFLIPSVNDPTLLTLTFEEIRKSFNLVKNKNISKNPS
jgi:hypothetical protein